MSDDAVQNPAAPSFTLDEILAATGAEVLRKSDAPACRGVSTDTRTIEAGNLYVPLKGPHFDGHDFIDQAIAKGAWGVLRAKDTLGAYQAIAGFHRQRFSIPVVAITGSSGKTTTKEMLASIASQQLNVLKTEANYNNEVGVPRMLLALRPEHQAAVLELALQRPGEIEPLSAIVKPTIGIITNVGPAHMEFFGSVREIALSKSDLYSALDPQGYAIVNADDPQFGLLMRRAEGSNIVTFGIDHPADLKAEDIRLEPDKSSFTLAGGNPATAGAHSIRFEVPLPGRHMISNALAAIAAARLLHLDDETIQKGLAAFRPLGKRMEITEKNGVRILNDCYNANPDSMRAALDVLALQQPAPGGRRIAVLGDMLELGNGADEEHIQLGRFISGKPIDLLLTIGEKAEQISFAAAGQPAFKGKTSHFPNKTPLSKYLRKNLLGGDVVLFKGSRGMKMEELI